MAIEEGRRIWIFEDLPVLSKKITCKIIMSLDFCKNKQIISLDFCKKWQIISLDNFNFVSLSPDI
jgi:hypothetical protein